MSEVTKTKTKMSPAVKYLLWFFGIVTLLFIIYVIYRLSTNTEKRFTDNFWFDGQKVGFISVEPHGLKEGDTIVITQAPGAVFPAYNGETKVIKIVDDRKFVTEKTFAGNTPANPGVYQRTNIF